VFTDRGQAIILSVLIVLHINSVARAGWRRKETIAAELLQELIFIHEQDFERKLEPWEVDFVDQFAREQVEKDPEGMAQKAKWLSENRPA
jgi:hypothetical protein